MGQQLVKMFEQVAALGSEYAKMRLAMKTLMSEKKAMTEPDSAENLRKFMDAIREMEKEFKYGDLIC